MISPSSIYGIISAGDVPPYQAFKDAVRLKTKNDAVFLSPDQIRGNSVHPGYIWTPMIEKSQRRVRAGRRSCARPWRPCIRRTMASDESKFITGTELVIDGGYTAR